MYFDLLIYLQLNLISFMLIMFMYKYMLILLLLVELMVMNMSLLMFNMMMIYNVEFMLIYYLVFSVCESVLGLGVLVSLIRFNDNNMYYMFNLSKF